MTDPRIEPALSADEWRDWLSPEFSDIKIPEDIDQYPRHMVAALCLYQQPFGFSHRDLGLILNTAKAFEEQLISPPPGINLDAWRETTEGWRSLAARIAALLPPQETP